MMLHCIVFSDADVASMRNYLSLIEEISGSTYFWWLSGNDPFEEDSWTFVSGRPVPYSVFHSVYSGSPRQTSPLSLVGIPPDTVL